MQHAEARHAAVEAVLDPPMQDTHFHLQSATSSEALSALWCVQYTTEDWKANLVWAKFLVAEFFCQDFVGRFTLQFDEPGWSDPSPEQPRIRATATGLKRETGAKTAGESTATAKEDAEDEDLGPMREVCITVPVLVNTSEIKVGQELMVFRPAQPKRK